MNRYACKIFLSTAALFLFLNASLFSYEVKIFFNPLNYEADEDIYFISRSSEAEVEEIDYSERENEFKGKKTSVLPFVLISRDIESQPFFKDLLSAGFLKKHSGTAYAIAPLFLPPTTFLKKPVEKNRLDIFLPMNYEKVTDILRRIIELRSRGHLKGIAVQLRFLPPDKDVSFSLVEEALRQKVIQEAYPGKYFIYCWYRIQNFNDPESVKDALYYAELDESKVKKLMSVYTLELLKADWNLAEELGISDISFFWENRSLLKYDQLTSVPGLGEIYVPSSGGCSSCAEKKDFASSGSSGGSGCGAHKSGCSGCGH